MPKISRDLDPALKGLPSRLKQAREALGVSGRDLRERTGADISRYEAGNRIAGMSASVILALARELGVSPGWLLTGEGPMRTDGRFVVLELTPELLKLLRSPAANLPAGSEALSGKQRR